MSRQAVTFLPTESLTDVDRFYGGVLQLPLVRDQGSCRIYRVGNDAHWGFCLSEQPMPEADRITLTLVVDDVDDWYERMVDAGIDVDGQPRDNPRYAIYHFYAIAPDGYRLEVQRFHEPLV